jgi:tRNA A-37 threonylcarbamoyl transferase component Bud32
MLPLTPTKLGRYEIVDEIGKGAMGVVYLARDPLIGRLVALKTFRIGYSVKDQELEQFRIRFMREAQSAGILTHPNIVTIHDVVEASEEGLAFIAMEYVRGTNLKLMLQGDQPMTLPFALDLICQVGEALDYAHANRVIHRDVKPANILITTDNRVKITDFGIARLESSNLTQEGQLLGTPNYMAPEQIQGKEIDHRADLFSLGIVLYEMLTRHKPFQGENLTVVSHRIVYDHFTPPREYARDLPPGIDRILSRALEKDPGRRYQRARELVDDLRQVVEATGARRDDLNETQSLSSTVVLPPAAVPPPVPEATAPGAPAVAEGAPDLADTVATAAPVRRRSSPRRLLAVGAAALVLSLLVWTAALLWTGWSQPPGKQRDAGQDGSQARILALVRQGQDAQKAGDWPAAAFYYRQAEALDPKAKGLRQLRETADRNQTSSQGTSRQAIIDFGLSHATRALEAQSWDTAIASASGVLLIDPTNLQARAIQAKAQEAKARQPKRQVPQTPRNRGDQMASTAPLTSAETLQPGSPEPAQNDSGTASIHIHIKAETEGSVVVSVGRRELVRKNFARTSLFRGRKLEQTEFDHTEDIPAGDVELQVLIAPTGKGGTMRRLPQNLRGGSAHRLEVVLSPSGGSASFN